MSAGAALDLVLRGAFVLFAVASVIALPGSLGRLPDGSARLDLLASTGVVALLLTAAMLLLLRSRLLPRVDARGSARLIPVVLFIVATVSVSAFEFRGWPQFPDTFAELFHARLLASGHAFTAAPARPELLQIANTVVDGGRWYSQYPIGNPALLSLGLRTGVLWLPVLLVSALLAAGTYDVANAVAGRRTAVIALLLACASPMLVLSTAALMSQATMAALGIAAIALALRAERSGSLRLAAAAAFTGALSAAVRPLDAVVLCACVGIYFLASERLGARAVAPALAAGAAGVVPLLIGNAATTGEPLRFGYSALWGSGNMPGFGTRGWGVHFGPVEAMRNTGFDLATLNLALLEWPVPVTFVLAFGVFTFARPLPRAWRLLLGWAVAHIAMYFLYWHHDFYFGPRFLLPLVPALLVLLGATLERIATAALKTTPARAARLFVFLQAACAAVLVAWPRFAHAESGIVAGAAAVDAAAHASLPSNAIVLVNDGWGSRLIARMWGAGVSAPVSEQLYASVNACSLELALMQAPRVSTAELRARLAGAPRGVPLGRAPEPNLRVPRGAMPPECAQQLAFDQRTYRAQFAPLLWRNPASGQGIVFMRDPGPTAPVPIQAGPVFRAVLLEGTSGPVVTFEPVAAPPKEVRVAS